jgi:chemotaxis protein MotB
MSKSPVAGVRPIVIRKVRKAGHAAHHGGAWKVAYADFVTAMMAFFMLLWLISSPDKEKLKGLAQYFSPAPPTASQMTSSPGKQAGVGGRTQRMQADAKQSNGQPTADPATVGTARGGTAMVPDSSMRVMAEELKLAIDSAVETPEARHDVRIEQARDGLRISLMDSARRSMFRGMTAQLNPDALAMLQRIAGKLRKSGSRIAIEGHTDSVGGGSDGNWRLSGDRAQAARSAMVGAGLSPDHFSEVVALAGSQPLYPDQPDRPENRRITVVIIAESPALPSDVSFKF